MKEQLQKIIELSKIDEEIDSYGPKEDKLKENLTKLVDKQNSLLSEIEKTEDEIKECRFKKNKNDANLKDLAQKLSEMSKKSAQLKTEREIKALQIEEEIAKEQIAFANEEIERLDKIESSKAQKVTELKEQLGAMQSQIKESTDSLQGELGNIEKSKQEVYTRKEKLIFSVNPKVLSFYQKIRRWAGNTTVAPLKNHACMGCFIVVADNIYRNVIRFDEIVTCPNCGRILYMEPEEESQPPLAKTGTDE